MDDGATDDGTVFATRKLKELNAIPDIAPPLHYNSLLVELGEQIYRYREFVLFHGDQVYPCVPLALQTAWSCQCPQLVL